MSIFQAVTTGNFAKLITIYTTAPSRRQKRYWLRQVLQSDLRGYGAKSVRFWPNRFAAIKSRMYYLDCEHVWRKRDSELEAGSWEGGCRPSPQGPARRRRVSRRHHKLQGPCLQPRGSRLHSALPFSSSDFYSKHLLPASSFPPQRTFSSVHWTSHQFACPEWQFLCYSQINPFCLNEIALCAVRCWHDLNPASFQVHYHLTVPTL